MRFLSFDIEISDVFELAPGEDLDKYAPFDISVASTVVHGGEERLWYSTGTDDTPSLNITAERASELLHYLDEMQQSGVMVCAWNGLGFDLRWIGHAAGDTDLAARVALASYDPMFQFFNQRGFPVGLAKVAAAMNIEQEKLMDGADAPKRWREGRYEEVMAYVLGDSQITNKIVAEILERKEVSWITAKGVARSEPMPRLKPVAKVIADPEPDQSWMDTPMPRSKFFGWIPERLLEQITRE
ncbi:MAG: ribonuclease H-like domain-containing protein [Candidatus Binatia bacterium]